MKTMLAIWVEPKNKHFPPHIWIEGGLFTDVVIACSYIDQLKETGLYSKIKVVEMEVKK